MSESILSHGYLPEEHAPDPVIGHGDPTPPGKIAIWMFLASEIMFFIGVLGTYIVLRSGSPTLFSHHAEVLNKTLGGFNTLVLLLSSATMYYAVDAAHKNNRKGVIAGLVVTLCCAAGFMCVKYTEYKSKFEHHTIVAGAPVNGEPTGAEAAAMEKAAAAKNKDRFVYDGHVHYVNGQRVLEGYKIPIPAGFNIHLISEGEVKHMAAEFAGVKNADELKPSEYEISDASVSQDINYGPYKNVFFASYFTTTGVHAVHVLGGMIAISILLVFALRGRVMPAHTEYIGLYWHFVDLVWIFLFPLLYLI